MWKAAPGSMIGGYELIEKLGRGGFNEVWSARSVDGGPVFALKMLLADDPKAFRQALREARICERIDHPHVVSVHEVFSDDELLVQVMEYLRGGNLRELMVAGDRSDRWFPPNVIREIGGGLAMALDHLTHGRGPDRSEPWRVVHRDIKPSNVLLGGEGQIKLADFGIFRAPEHLTATIGPQACTPRYAAPEVLQESPGSPESDLFSLGCVLYELVMRRQAFEGEQLAMMHFKVQEFDGEMHRPSLEAKAPEFADIIVRLLDRYPERRPSADEVRQAMIGNRRVYDPVPLLRYMQRVRPVGQATTQKLSVNRAAPPAALSPEQAAKPRTWAATQVGLGVTVLLLFAAVVALASFLAAGPGAEPTAREPVDSEPVEAVAAGGEVEPLPAPPPGVEPLPAPRRTPTPRATPEATPVPTPDVAPSAPLTEEELAALPEAESTTEPTTEPSPEPTTESTEEPTPAEATPAPRPCLLVSSDRPDASISINGALLAQTTSGATGLRVPEGDVEVIVRSEQTTARWAGPIEAGGTRHIVCSFAESDPARRCYSGVVRAGMGCR